MEELKMKEKDINNLTLHKSNSLIRGKLQNYSLEQLKLLNTIYSLIQKNLEVSEKHKKIIISFDTLLRGMGYKSEDGKLNDPNLYRIFSKENRKILYEPIELYNYTNSKGETYLWKEYILITSIGVKKGYENSFELDINPEFFHILKQSKLFTHLDLSLMNISFNSKFQYRLYEYLKSYENLKQKYITIDINDYNDIMEEKQIHLSTIIRKIQRSLEIIKEKTEMEVSVAGNKRLKTLTFTFISKSKLEKNLISNEKRNETIIKNQEERHNEYINDIVEKVKNKGNK